jgi:transcriptional regulator with XRE-family HTH domain
MPRTAHRQSAAYGELVKTLVELRDARGLSQRELAEILGVSPAHVGKVERAETPLRLDDVARWAVALEAPGDVLLTAYWTEFAAAPRRRRRVLPR